jgi:hypothetical protein
VASCGNYTTPRNIPEERRSHHHYGGSLKSRGLIVWPVLIFFSFTILCMGWGELLDTVVCYGLTILAPVDR